MSLKSKATPFANDCDYIAAEIGYMAAKANRIGAEREAKQQPRSYGTRRVLGPLESTETKEHRRRIAGLKLTEDELKADLDARLAINRSNGPALGLDAVCDHHDLNAFERAVLLVTSIVACGEHYADLLDPATRRGMMGGATAEDCWQLMEMPLADRVQSHLSFLPTARMMAAGLISVRLGAESTPSSLSGAVVEVTSPAWAAIVGLDGLVPGKIDASDFEG